MTSSEFEIAFYEAMVKWAAGGKVGPDPRGEWEFAPFDSLAWVQGRNIIPYFEPHTLYRWKPAKKHTVIIDGVELVAPEVDAPEKGKMVFIETANGCVYTWKWAGEDYDGELLANGSVFLTREDCQAMADAQHNQRLGETK